MMWTARNPTPTPFAPKKAGSHPQIHESKGVEDEPQATKEKETSHTSNVLTTVVIGARQTGQSVSCSEHS